MANPNASTTHLSAASELPGARRGAGTDLPVGSLGLAEPPEGANYHAHALREQVHAGKFDAAFEELAAADWEHIEQRPLLRQVRDAVAWELTDRASIPYPLLLHAALQTMNLTSLTA